MRDKLIELLKKKYDHYCDQCGVNKDTHYLENLADYLIANGVTFADVPETNVGKWIPVSERLPERAMAITGKRTCSSSDAVLVYVERTGVILIAEYWHDGGFWEEPEENQTIWDVTHWMPLPEPPKEGE